MLKSTVLEYVDRVMSKMEVSDDVKVQLENELIRQLLEASESTSIDDVKSSLYPPERLADEIINKLEYNKRRNSEDYEVSNSEQKQMPSYRRHHHPRYRGEYMREQSNVNLKLLYIPLVQISSGTERISMPLTDDDYDD